MHKEPSAGVKIYGIGCIIDGVLAFIPFMIDLRPYIDFSGIAFNCLRGIVGITGGLGVLCLKEWARQFVIYAMAILPILLIGLLIIWESSWIAIVYFAFIRISIAIITIVFFNDSDVKEQFKQIPE